MTHLRFMTYLAPGIPLELFKLTVAALGTRLGVSTELLFEPRYSGPAPSDSDADLGADFAWICTSCYLWMTKPTPPRVRRVPAGMVFDDPRSAGRPVYHSEIVVPRDHPARTFADLRGSHWVYNDSRSQSGYYNLLGRLAESGEDLHFFQDIRCSGSHRASLATLERGEADLTCVDSNVLRSALRERPALEKSTRILDSSGPHVIQPMVAGNHVADELFTAVGHALLELLDDTPHGARLRELGLVGFETTQEEHYEAERSTLESAERLLADASRSAHSPSPVAAPCPTLLDRI